MVESVFGITVKCLFIGSVILLFIPPFFEVYADFKPVLQCAAAVAKALPIKSGSLV